MRRYILIFLCLVLLIVSSLPCMAAQPKIVDDAELLTSDEVALLEAKAQQLTQTYGMDVVILTCYSFTGNSIEAFADDYYDNNGYGIGDDYSGVLFMLSMEYRDWAISTCGDTIYALTDYGTQELFSDIAPYLSDDEYYLAFDAYLDLLEEYFSAYDSGTPIDGVQEEYYGPGSYESATQEDVVYYDEVKDFSWYIKKFFISLVVGAIVALIVLLIMRSNMNTARQQHGADSYVRTGSCNIHRHQDLFLYSTVNKVRRQENSSSGSSGGSSVHRGSSGRSHGGGHGKF